MATHQPGTGYISFADYMHGNQDTIEDASQRLGDQALSGLNDANTTYHTDADAAAGHTSEGVRQALNDQYGFDTGQGYGVIEDYRATRAANPDVPWQGVQPATRQDLAKPDEFTGTVDEKKAYLANQSLPKDAPFIHGPTMPDGTPLPGTGTNNDSTNPFATELAGGAMNTADLRRFLGSTDAGKLAEGDLQKVQNKAGEVGNLENWGGVFDAYKQQYGKTAGYGSGGAAFDATLTGRGMQGAADKGKAIGKGANAYYDQQIDAHKTDRAGDERAGNSTYVSPPVAPNTDQPYTWNPLPSDAGGGWQDNKPPPAPVSGPTPTSTDDSGQNRGDPSQPPPQQGPTPDDPWAVPGGG